MKAVRRLLLLFTFACAAGALSAQTNLFFTGSWVNNPAGLPACGATLQNCYADVLVQDTTASPALALCTGAGLATTCKSATAVINPTSWPYGTSHTVTFTAQYYGATTGTLLNGGAGTLSVENLVVQAPGAPTAPTGSLSVSLVVAPAIGKGWLMDEPETEQANVAALIG